MTEPAEGESNSTLLHLSDAALGCGLVDSSELLTATECARHLVFDPRGLRGDKPSACF
jgi:hypothetical protein